ncbi:MAG: UDP-3-O-(3-hydroxymyristoyl)glucosamine N-acyltransferase [Phycisphaerae bacterium]|nr:UDP-3-O-(3-hydroxymyristoyl)glucosamine N-acyltransferase [Phycisphaerae bacterium]
MRLDELAARIGAQLAGDGAIEVASVATLENAKAGQLSFVSNPKYAKLIESTQASALVVSPNVNSDRLALLKAKNPYFAFCKAIVTLHGHRRHPHGGVHPTAFTDPSATIGEGTVIYPGAYVGPRCKVGRDCILYAGVNLYDDTIIGDRVIVHSGAVIGADGYGFATEAGVHHKIPQIGNVVIEDDVEIGANCSIARGALESTRIGAGTKIDALVQVGHGTTIGPHCLLVAQVGISGSVTIGHHVVIGGQVGVTGHLEIGDQVSIGAKSGVINDVAPKSVVLGSPAIEYRRALRVAGLMSNLPELAERIKRLEKQAGMEPGVGGEE